MLDKRYKFEPEQKGLLVLDYTDRGFPFQSVSEKCTSRWRISCGCDEENEYVKGCEADVAVLFLHNEESKLFHYV